ncbi:hypothetical protein FF38_05305 [Lucilia cuprina]|uniref:Uncharacterized protein n=1 Tax=Lucilia cuprina TaxID=7375 RepID=A0A0L0BRL6_LUCCU|nr:hypothetical protein FF38_05305 [Lucilia cuprina]
MAGDELLLSAVGRGEILAFSWLRVLQALEGLALLLLTTLTRAVVKHVRDRNVVKFANKASFRLVSLGSEMGMFANLIATLSSFFVRLDSHRTVDYNLLIPDSSSTGRVLDLSSIYLFCWEDGRATLAQIAIIHSSELKSRRMSPSNKVLMSDASLLDSWLLTL